MITHLNYIEDKGLRDYIYDTLNEISKEDGANFIAVDDELWGCSKSKIYYYEFCPTKNGMYWNTEEDHINLAFYEGPYTRTPYSLNDIYNVFNNTEEVYDIEAILRNWEVDQKENILTEEKIKEIENSEVTSCYEGKRKQSFGLTYELTKAKTEMLQKILSPFDLKINKPFQHKTTKKFFRINEEADIEIYENGRWRRHLIKGLVDIIDSLYDDYDTVYDFNVDFEKELNKQELSPKVVKVIKSILETNYIFMKIHPHENRIVLHMNTDSVPLIIYTDKKTIEWFLKFIENNTSGTKILYISRLKAFWEEYNYESNE